MMTNYQYELQYQDLRQRGRLRFNPTPRLTPFEYRVLLCGLSLRLCCPRLPRLGERVLVRASEAEAVWTERLIEAEGVVDGTQTEAFVDGVDAPLVRGTYSRLWRFAPGSGPAEVLQ